MLQECLRLLVPSSSRSARSVYVDATFGAGGHTAALLQAQPDAIVVALDADPQAVQRAKELARTFPGRLLPRHANFAQLDDALDHNKLDRIDGILFDLGISSLQLGDAQRGFSFAGDEPLDMRLDPSSSAPSAARLLATLPQPELERILREYGDEHHARAIARSIVRRRPRVSTWRTGDLVAAVLSSQGRRPRGRIHPATRTFQALRIAVNDDLNVLESGLHTAMRRLRPHGRMVVISFHSGEDRVVKRCFRSFEQQHLARGLTRKPLRPTAAEVAANARSRSAKLRAIEATGLTDDTRREH
jgi:16S rRNA (cytosine1402-N4)-methyltransferase